MCNMGKKSVKNGYLAPAVELFPFMTEEGFAISPFLRGDSDGKGKSVINNPSPNQIGQYQDGVDWTSETWN